ncbi:MAG: hypothetical protein AAGD13_11935 [Pseudomonadota bacterium]
MAAMAKFVQAPVSEQPADVQQSVPDPSILDAVGVFVLALMATLFVGLMVRGLLMKSSKPKGPPAAMTGKDYTGKGFGKTVRKKEDDG